MSDIEPLIKLSAVGRVVRISEAALLAEAGETYER